MAILDSDIKLLKSAVMADTTDGGGAMTGTAVVDGASNNLFPDTSELDRAFGRVQMRKVFGVAHTDDTDSLLGAHAIVVDDADDPLVKCTLLKTAGWSDTRSAAKDVIERYVVKGPRLTGRLMDAHYAGARTINMMDPGGMNFPASGDAIVLRKPDGTEQYVRVIKVTVTQQTFTVPDALGGTFTANVAAVELGQALSTDFTGPPIQKVIPNEANYTAVYTTNVATGAEFCGVKPLAAAVLPGDLFVMTTGGIFTPLVPAATVETPIIDVFPLTTRSSLVNTSAAATVLPSVTHTLAAGAQIATPTPIKPGSLVVVAGAATLSDDGLGNLNAGSTVVAAIDYKAGVVTFLPSSPNYGSVTTGVTYMPATLVGASCFSMSFTITSANQGLAYTQAFQPPPAPGSFTISYMAQGRWYALADNLAGKVEGADPSYGVGTLNYTTGSMAVTLGALPDVGSSLIVDYGDANAAKAVDAPNLPAKMGIDIPVPNKASAVGTVITWSRGAVNYTATTGADGQFAGDATGSCDPGKGKIRFEPTNFPDTASVHVLYKSVPTDNTAITDNGAGSYTLTANLPVVRGSFSATLALTWPPGTSGGPTSAQLYDRNGVLLLFRNGSETIVGSINYTTGAISINGTLTMPGVSVTVGGAIPAWGFEPYSQVLSGTFAVGAGALTNVRYSSGVESTTEFDHTITGYTAEVGTHGLPLRSTGLLFALGGEFYSGAAGALRRGWSVAGTGVPVDSGAGSIASTGIVTLLVAGLPVNGVNGLTWHNAAVDMASTSIGSGVFRTASAPLKTGVLQLQSGAAIGTGNDQGVISGGFTGSVDYQRGIVKWVRALTEAATLSYNAVFLQYLPLDASILGLETARLPLDGKVPIFRPGGLVIVHNTQNYNLPNPLVKDTIYNVGRERIAYMRVKTATGATVSSTLYTADYDAGTLVFPVASDLTGLAQPFSVEHRIEDMVLCSIADISGKLTFTRALTHDFPANTSFASGAVIIGDVFARAHNYIEQMTWTVWSDTLIGSAPTANYNETLNPIEVTNRGAITERWALIFTNTTTFRIVGEFTGEIGTGSTGADCAPVNPATGVPYFTIRAAGWGAGWSVGNVYRFNTAACGAPVWVVRTVLQGPATLQDDKFTIAFRGDVDRP